jgi:hypothetical protein
MLSPFAALVVATLVTTPPVAPGGAEGTPAVTGREWYGAPALVVDGLALTLGATGYGVRNEGLFFLGTAGYFLGAPLNHIVNGRPGAAAGSLILRALGTGLAVAVFIGDYTSGGCDGDPTADSPSCHRTRALLLGGLVLAGFAILDDVRIARAAEAPAPQRRATLAPGLVITPNLGFLSLGGAF